MAADEGEKDEESFRETEALVSQVTDYPEVRNSRDAYKLFVTESKKLWSIGGPIAFNIICLYGVNSATQIFAGHIGSLELSAVAIGLNVISNFSFGFLLGMGSALETLSGQAFGAGQVEMLGTYLQRSWIILVASSCLMCPFYIFATPFLKFIGQKDDIAELAGKFTISIIPQMFALAIDFPAQKFLQAQSKVIALAWIGFVTLWVHVGLLWLFIFVFDWGVSGAAAAYDVSSWFVSITQVIYIVGWCNRGWKGLSWLAFKDLWPFVRLSIASAVMLCLEICLNINALQGMLFIGLNAAISVRVSNELGSGRPRAAKYAVSVVLVQSFAIGLICMANIIATKDLYPAIFTNDKVLRKAVSDLAYFLSITVLLSSIQPVISGVAVGGGWQAVVAYINLGCYYIFGLPLGFVMGYHFNWGVKGIWAGMICGTLVQTLVLLVIVWKTDWKAEAALAAERVREWGGQEHPN